MSGSLQTLTSPHLSLSTGLLDWLYTTPYLLIYFCYILYYTKWHHITFDILFYSILFYVILLYYTTYYVIPYYYTSSYTFSHIPYYIIMYHIILYYVNMLHWLLHYIVLIQTNTNYHYLTMSYISLVYKLVDSAAINNNTTVTLITTLSLYLVLSPNALI